MPRTGRPDDRVRREHDDDRPPRGAGPRPTRRNIEQEVIALRETGRSFASVASSLGMKRAMDAHAAFVRGLRALPPMERGELASRESARLDRLEARIRSRDEAEPDKMARRLVALDKLRATLL